MDLVLLVAGMRPKVSTSIWKYNHLVGFQNVVVYERMFDDGDGLNIVMRGDMNEYDDGIPEVKRKRGMLECWTCSVMVRMFCLVLEIDVQYVNSLIRVGIHNISRIR